MSILHLDIEILELLALAPVLLLLRHPARDGLLDLDCYVGGHDGEEEVLLPLPLELHDDPGLDAGLGAGPARLVHPGAEQPLPPPHHHARTQQQALREHLIIRAELYLQLFIYSSFIHFLSKFIVIYEAENFNCIILQNRLTFYVMKQPL